jgi:hypothetical protein
MGLAFPGGLTGSQRHVARPRDSPLIVSREQDSTDQAGSGDADDPGEALDLTIRSYQWIGRVDLRPVVLGKLIKASTSVSASSIRAASLGIGSDLIGDPGLRGGRLVWGF